MTRDLFDYIDESRDKKCYRSQYVKSIVDSLLDDSGIENNEIDHLLPKVAVSGEESGKFLIKAICKHDVFFSKFIHRFVHSEVEQIEGAMVFGFSSFPYQFFELDSKKYLVTEIEVCLNREDSSVLEQLEAIGKQVRLGLESSFYSRMVLEMKGNSSEGKRLRVQERIIEYIHRFPEIYDYDVLPLVSECIPNPKESFAKERSERDLAKIIITAYLFEKKMKRKGAYKGSSSREVYVKTMVISIDSFLGRKHGLGVVVGLSHLSENEKMGKEHALKACRKIISKVHVKEDTFRCFSKGNSNAKFLYFELEKKEREFSFEERKKIQQELPGILDEHVQTYTRKIFMPQNTEEVMKYTVALSKELKSSDDYPQVAVLFDSQTEDSLIFTAIVVKPKNYKGKSVFDYFASFEKKQKIRIKHIRSLGEFKEGVELSYTVKIHPFLREDYTVDIYRARGKVVLDLQSRFGGIRDYNGGMLEKQEGLLGLCHSALKRKGIKNTVLIDNFFYSLFPQEMRAIMDVNTFADFFMGFYDVFSQKHRKDTVLENNCDNMVFFARVKLKKRKEFFVQEMRNFELSDAVVIYFSITIQNRFYLGATFLHPTAEVKESFSAKMSLCFKL